MKFAKLGSLQSVVLAIACACAGGTTSYAFAADNTEAAKTSAVSNIQEPLGDSFSIFDRVTAKQTRVIFYRPTTQKEPGAATVYVNGRYHASLIPGGYAQLCMLPKQATVGVRMVKVGDPAKDGLDTTAPVNLAAGQTTFLRVREPGTSRATLQPIAANEALAELQTTRQQIHTLSRVADAQECVDGASEPQVTPVPAQAKPDQINLAADALFAFSKSDKNSMTAAGRQSLDNLISKIKAEYLSVERINVVGHADPLGNEALNERLANDRALTVRAYLLSHGLQNTRITGQSKGAREPVVTTCGRELSATAIQCNQPNRRVVVEISGVHRKN
ncbi:OmpA family protein [Limnohabitans sp. Jir72]|uniref:OmpA family protein n=1 Tax=Limnohabitans sp. Jir72 TaxID=1977909 RepID=UPI001304D4AA|nr:OmpA family protein [Limnohabitans sp. Jir72]